MSGQHSALLLIDLQEAFFEEPTLAAARSELIDSARELAEAARRSEVPILLITTEHSRDRSTWTLSMLDDDQRYLFPGNLGTAVVRELDTEGMTRVEKTRDSAWFGTDLLLRLRNLQVERVVMAGVSTRACIAQTARDAYANNVRAVIVNEAVTDERADHMEMVLDQLSGDRQAELATVEETIGRWTG